MEDIKLLLVGNPNAGKSTLFNALTGGHARVGNWHGVTVGALEGRLKGRKDVTVCDLPGIYSVESMSMEERFTREHIAQNPQSPLVLVAECGALARSLPLFSALAKDRRAMLVVTKRRAFLRAGGKIDLDALKAELKIPVVDGECKKAVLRQELSAFLETPAVFSPVLETKAIVPPPEGLGKLDSLLLNGFFGLPLFFLLLAAVFYLTFASGSPGDFCKNAVNYFFTDTLVSVCSRVASPVLKSFLCDGLLSALGGVLCFLPQIALLYLFLIVLEESGLFSRLAILTDGAFAKIGLSGRAVFSLLLGFGCTAAAILTTRSLDDKKMQRRTVLCLPYIACSAKLPVFLTLSASFFSNPFFAVLLLYALGVGISIAVSVFLKDKKPPFLLELAPLQIPRPRFVLKSLLFQLKQFIIKVATVVTAFFLVSWLLSSLDFSFCLCPIEESMLAKICSFLSFLFAPAGMNDWRIAYAALSGLIAKENIAGALAMFYGVFPYSPQSAFAFAVFVLTCSPCVSAIAATGRELGVKRALLYAVLQTVSALLLCYLCYFALTGGAVWCILLLLPAVALLCYPKKRNPREKVHRHKKHHAQRVHR